MFKHIWSFLFVVVFVLPLYGGEIADFLMESTDLTDSCTLELEDLLVDEPNFIDREKLFWEFLWENDEELMTREASTPDWIFLEAERILRQDWSARERLVAYMEGTLEICRQDAEELVVCLESAGSEKEEKACIAEAIQRLRPEMQDAFAIAEVGYKCWKKWRRYLGTNQSPAPPANVSIKVLA